MTAKERFLAALNHQPTDRLPVTTHHLMDYFLNKYAGGLEPLEFHKQYGFDPIVWPYKLKPIDANNEYLDETTGLLCSDNWRLEVQDVPNQQYPTQRYIFHTPKGDLSCVLQQNGIVRWQTEHLIKEKKDIEIFATYVPHPHLDVDFVNVKADEVGSDALVRGYVSPSEPFGQPGCWQDLACLFGIEDLIMETYDDPDWVNEFLQVLQDMKKTYLRSSKGAKYDILELGGGDASTTVISPTIFDEFVAPFDKPLVDLAHEMGHKIVYHTCGGMMPILENIADMGVNAMETFTPKAMGADVDLAEAKRRIGDRVCMIGGFDQGHYLFGCTEEVTRKEVRRCFEAAGQGGGFILSPSDHYFDADINLIRAFVDEAHKCTY